MFKKLMLAGAVALAGAAVVSAALVSAQEGPPPPSAGSSIASGLSSTGGVIGPDGALYVAIGGEAPTEVTVPDEFVELAGVETVYFGLTGSVARVDLASGEVTTAADGLPVSSFEGPEEGSGPTDVTFLNGTMYVLVTGSIQPFGGPAADYPNGVYRQSGDGWTVVADISAFNDANPVEFPDAAPGGNPFAIVNRGTGFIVSDGNYNRLLNVSTGGDISILASFDNVVPTGLESSDTGPVLNTWFSAAPHNPGDSYVQQVGYPSGDVVTLASGPAQLIDVQAGAGGVYVLQFGDQQLDENAPPPPGRLYRLQGGQLTAVVEGLMLPTSLSFSGDNAYITSLTGEVYEIPGVSTLTGVTPEPTAAPTTAPPPSASPTVPVGTVTPPDTGSGGNASQSATLWLAIVLLGVASASCAVLAKVTVRR
jgi:hypothetical protein